MRIEINLFVHILDDCCTLYVLSTFHLDPYEKRLAILLRLMYEFM